MKIATMVTVVAVLLNAMMPTLAHAATYLQGAEVNANTLTQDAYVQVTYYESNGEQKLVKGWIDAVGETSFTIREGGFLGKKTIAFDKVVSVIMSEESTVPAKQMNEVKRFIRNMKAREIEQAKKEVKTGGDQTKSETNTEAIQRPNQTEYVLPWYINDTRTVTVMARGQIDYSKITKGWYAHVVYTSTEGAKKTEIGQIVNKDTNHIFVKDRIDRITTWTIAYDDIDTLVVAKQWSDIERYRESGETYNVRVRFKAPSVSKRPIIGRLVVVKQDTLIIGISQTFPSGPRRRPRPVEVTFDTLMIQDGSTFYQVPLSSISNLEVSVGQHRNTFKGMAIGLTTGLAIVTLALGYAEHVDETSPDDSLDALGIALGGMAMGGLVLVLSTLIGAATKSDKWVAVPPQRLNLSLAPTSTKGLRAALTFNF
ncbi:MAG: hypothetical protein OXL96_03605 [Candidatus Poribacteria bacterium]|nr:hypothetical protein [Candidatus Poribacteria bacterium]